MIAIHSIPKNGTVGGGTTFSLGVSLSSRYLISI